MASSDSVTRIRCPRKDLDSPCHTNGNLPNEVKKALWWRGRLADINKFIGFIGDWGVGKDSLALRVLDQKIPVPKLEQDHPRCRIGESGSIKKAYTNEYFKLTIRIIPGEYIYRLREDRFFDTVYPGHYYFDAVVFCFALNSRASFRSLRNKWIPDAIAATGYQMPPYILAGTKGDLARHITKESAWELMELSGAVDYADCSGTDDVSIERIRNVLSNIFNSL